MPVYVNDKPVELGSQRWNCIQAAQKAGVFIPHYCWHEALSVVASCRMCLVEIGEWKDGKVVMQPKVVPGCQTPVKDGMVIVTGEYDRRDPSLPPLPYDAAYLQAGPPGSRAKKAQADTLEALLLNHPLDCPVCDKAGECLLQDYSFRYGRSTSRMIDPKNMPPNKPHISSKITLFTDRCIMCTRCVRFTREISGTAELCVVRRGHHEEIDIFPGRPLENKLAGNVVDLCPVGALGSKDFLYKQRVWYLHSQESVCSRCSTGCSIYVDSNKDIVYRLRPRVNPQVNGHFMCDEGRYGYHFTHSSQRIRQPSVRWPTGEASSDSENRRLLSWSALFPRLRQAWQSIGQRSDTRLLLVVSPFLTVEEAYLLTLAVRTLTPQVQLALGPVPIVGEDDRYPKDVHGRPIEPAKFVIRAEKCPNRRGVEAILRRFATEVVSFEQAITQYWDALWFAGGYPDVSMVDAALPPQGSVPTPTLLVVQDLFFSHLAQAAHFFLPATSSFEKEGTFINYAGVAQSFPRAIRPPMNIRSELQLAHELLGRPGLAQAASVRRELAQAIPELEHLTTLAEPVPRGRYALTTV